METSDDPCSPYDPPPGPGLCLCQYASECNVCNLYVTFWCLDPEDIHICRPECYAEAVTFFSDLPLFRGLKAHIAAAVN